MLHALLHGKLDLELPEPHRREDALTSSVFGTLRMVEAWDVLANWLEVEPLSSEQEDTVACWFWPRLAGAVEPDVVLRFGDTLVVVEAKYRSGRHDLSLDEADERPSDQIERQYNAVSLPPEARHVYPEGLERAVRERRRLAQVFVVDARRLRLARKEYKESRACLPQGARLTLATWQALDKLLSSPPCSRSRWASDLRSYLRLCGLSSFHGVPHRLLEAERVRLIERWSPCGRRGVALRLRDAAATLATTPLITDLRWSPCGRRGVAFRLRDAAATLSRSAELQRWRVRPVTKGSRGVR